MRETEVKTRGTSEFTREMKVIWRETKPKMRERATVKAI